jgi:hypothetical protein
MKEQRQKKEFSFEELTRGVYVVDAGVHVDGYLWREGVIPVYEADQDRYKGEDSWLTPVVPTGVMRRRAFLRIPDLHKRFGELQATPDKIRGFANKYGLLGHSIYLREKTDRSLHSIPPSISCSFWLYGEPLSRWRVEVDRMALLLELWRWISGGFKDRLSRHFKWSSSSNSHSVFYECESPNGYVTASGRLASERDGTGVEALKQWKPGDSIGPARYYVCREINTRLRGHISPTMVAFNYTNILMRPDCLLSTLYLHFALEITGQRLPSLECKGCGRYFDLPEGNRLRDYCEDKCRKKAWARKRAACKKILS